MYAEDTAYCGRVAGGGMESGGKSARLQRKPDSFLKSPHFIQ
jgi:hypothetical protein